MGIRHRYDDKFRASAVVALEAAGYPNSKGALAQVAKLLDVPAMTISRWFKDRNNPPPTEIVTEKRIDLLEMINTELEAIFGVLPNARSSAAYKDLMTGAGILIDKRQLLTGEPTENAKARIIIEYAEDPDA